MREITHAVLTKNDLIGILHAIMNGGSLKKRRCQSAQKADTEKSDRWV